MKSRGLRQTARHFTTWHPVSVEVNASHFHVCDDGMQALPEEDVCSAVDSDAM
jgi:hypothetical protein